MIPNRRKNNILKTVRRVMRRCLPTLPKFQPLAVAGLIYNILCLAGAFLMFRLRRIGFYVYLAGVAAGLILPVLFGGFSALNSSFGAFFSVIFAGLYWYNLPAMKS